MIDLREQTRKYEND